MALRTKLDKVSYESLSDEWKKEYIPDGDGYKLDADYEDVTGLKAKNAELLADIAKWKKIGKDFEGLDAEAARAAIAAAQTAEDDKLKAAGDFEKLREQLETRHQAELATATEKSSAILTNLRREKIANLAISKGILPERVRAAIAEGDLDSILDLNDADLSVRKKDGIGDAKEVDEIFDNLKTKSAWLFAADGASGSGASGSDGTGGGGKTMPHAQWKALPPKEQAAFIKAGGKPVD